jgi:hypothetical protein
MAYLQQNQDEDEQAQGMNQPQAPAPSEPVGGSLPPMTSGASMSAQAGSDAGTPSNAPTAPGGGKPSAAPASGMGGQFQKYIGANQGKASTGLANTVAGNLNRTGATAQKSVTNAQNQFNQKLEAGTLANRDQALNDVAKAVTQARNVYKGNIAEDQTKQQSAITSTQADITATQQFKEQEKAAIAAAKTQADQEKAAYAQQLKAERTAALPGAFEGQQYDQYATHNAGQTDAYVKWANEQRAAQKALSAVDQDVNSQFQDKYNQLSERERALSAQDTRESGLNAQLQKAQEQLAYLQDPSLVQAVDPETQARFADIINARYSGPQSLRQGGMYNPAQERVTAAQDKFNLAQTATGRQDLLSQLFGNQNYSRGLSGLDAALLNTNRGAIQGIQDVSKQYGNLQGTLDQAQVGSDLAAQNRTKEIAGIQEGARNRFTEGQNEQNTLTEGNIDRRLSDADEFANQLRSAFTDKTGAQTLSAAEAAILGLQSGEGLYGLGEGVVQTRDLERQKLVSRDEQARLAALSQLAGLDQSKRLNTNNMYENADLAGTQTATDILDRDAVREALANAEQAFRDQAAGTTVTGKGKGKGSSGGMFGSKSSTATKTLSANLKDSLAKSGAYDFNSDINRETLGSNDIIKNLTDALNYNQSVANGEGKTGTASGSINSAIGDVSQPELGATDVGLAATGANFTDPEFLRSLGASVPVPGAQLLGGIGANTLGAIPGISNLSNSISSAIGGSSSSAKSKAKKKAFDAAKKDLNKNYQNTLSNTGYYNRANVDNSDVDAQARSAALEALLRRIG